MTDKQIMIDGVDVSKCEFYDKDKGYCLTLKMNPKGFKNPSCFSGDFQECIQDSKTCPYTFCHNNSNCYYKQLARKTQECKKLNNKIIDMNSIIEDAAINLGNKDFTLYNLPFEIKKLSQERKELKKEIINKNEKIKELRFSVSDLTNRLCYLNAEKSFRIVDLEQTLTEIKEIAEPFCNACQEFEPEKKGSNCMYCNYGKILQKISEVEK